ncbi:MAG: hypothetical protein EOO15_17140 [Chitinophagaceae bacterium]|nr:MAG: hypothetical protein EOO15_17140 [Chitinophagaceae bacterium]
MISKSLILISALLAWAQSGVAQTVRNFQIQVCDSTSGMPIPYATVVSTSAKVGTYSDKTGHFLLSPEYGDTLLVSSIGYYKRKVAVDGIGNRKIFLAPYFREMKEISVGKGKIIGLDTFGIPNGPELMSLGSDRFTYEIAQKILVKKALIQKKYELRKVFIAATRFTDAVPVLLHIYSVGGDGLPDKDLLTTKRLLQKQDFDKKRKGFDLNLEEEHILLTDTAYFVSLEWLPVDPGLKPHVISLRLTDAIPETPSTTFLKRKQLYGTNTMISVEVYIID